MAPSISGMTSTAANEVCRRALASKGLMRTSRWTPLSLCKWPNAKSPTMCQVAGAGRQILVRLEQGVQRFQLLDGLLGSFGVIPKTWLAHLLVEFNAQRYFGRDVKDCPGAG